MIVLLALNYGITMTHIAFILCIFPSESVIINVNNDTLCDVQATFSYFCKLGTVCLAGDFNAQLDTESRCPPNQKSKLFSAFITRNGLIPMNTVFDSNAFTYVPSRSNLDYVLIEKNWTYNYTIQRC